MPVDGVLRDTPSARLVPGTVVGMRLVTEAARDERRAASLRSLWVISIGLTFRITVAQAAMM
jgi:hypothetical protein